MLSVLSLCILLYTVKAVPAPGHGALVGYCDTNQDCGKAECCVSFTSPRGKRAVDPKRWTQGKCHQLGVSGSGCLVQQAPNNIFYQSCPCISGLTCVGNGIITVPLGEEGVCAIQAKPKPCWTVSDCRPSECCVSNIRQKGKRSVEISKRQSAPGRCESLGQPGAGCLVKNGSGRPKDNMFLSCPCSEALTCKGLGVNDIPLGELGKCAAK